MKSLVIVLALGALVAAHHHEGSHAGHPPYSHYLEGDAYRTDRMSVHCFPSTDNDTVYNYTLERLDGEGIISFGDFREKVILIVNVATYCRSTREYPQLNELLTQFGDNLAIVATPCNQFGKQEPAANKDELLNGLKYVRPGGGFEPRFPLSKKIEVNGKNEDPLFTFLKRSCPSTRQGFEADNRLFWEPRHSRDVRWNFEKFLIHPRTGQVVKRYDEVLQPLDIRQDIQALLQEVQ